MNLKLCIPTFFVCCILLFIGCKNEQEKKELIPTPLIKTSPQEDSINLKLSKEWFSKGKTRVDSLKLNDTLTRDYFFKSREYLLKMGVSDFNQLNEVYSYISNYYYQNGDAANNAKYTTEFVHLYRKSDSALPEKLAVAYLNISADNSEIGKNYVAINEAAIPAIKLLKRAIPKATSVEKKNTLLELLLLNLRYYLINANELESLEHENQAIESIETFFARENLPASIAPLSAYTLSNLASTYIKRGEFEKARTTVDTWNSQNGAKSNLDKLIFKTLEVDIASQTETFNDVRKNYDTVSRLFKKIPSENKYKYVFFDNATSYYSNALKEKDGDTVMAIPAIAHKMIQLKKNVPVDFQQNNMSAFSMLIDYFLTTKKVDSAKFYINERAAIADSLNNKQYKDAYFTDLLEVNIILEDYESVLKNVNDFSTTINIASVNESDPLKFVKDAENILGNIETIKKCVDLSSQILEIYTKTNNPNYYTISKNLVIAAASIFKDLKVGSGLNTLENELLIKIKEQIVEIIKQDFKSSKENNILFLKLLEENYAQELIYKNSVQNIFPKTDKKLFASFIAAQNELLHQRRNLMSASSITEEKTRQVFNIASKNRDSIFRIVTEKYPEFANYTQAELTMDEIEQLVINKDQVKVRFFTTKNNLIRCTIGNNQIVFTEIDKKNRISSLIHSFRERIVSQEETHILEDSISSILFENWEPPKEGTSLVILAQGQLQSFPFEILKLKEQSLLNLYTIHYKYSLLNTSKKNKEINKNSALAIYTPSYMDKMMLKENIKQTIERSGVLPLEAAKEESQYIQSIMDGTMIAGKNATKKHFIDNNNQYKNFHLAMHAVVEPNENNKALLLFAGRTEEEFLSIDEIYNLDLQCNLITLSACNTNYGKSDPNEGMLSLSRAFQYAGAEATVTSLWRVPDRETSLIMKRFYYYINEGEQINVALANAKKDYLKNIEDPYFKHPYFWAGFILTGNEKPIVKKSFW